MKDIYELIFSYQETCEDLVKGEFIIKHEFLDAITNIEIAGKRIKEAFLPLKDILKDEKISWKEIDLLLTFIGSTIPSLWNESWNITDKWINDFSSSLSKLFKSIQYIRDIHARILPDGYDSEKHLLYYLDGVKYQRVLELCSQIIDSSPKKSINPINEDLGGSLTEILHYIGLIGRVTPPYTLITPNNKNIDQIHPLNVGVQLEQVTTNFFNQLPSLKLISLSQKAAEGLHEFLKDKKLSKDNFKARDFWGYYKKGIKEVDNLFTELNKNFI
ncbi:MAG: hypothetical protein ACW99R_05795 [Candidatus Hodarchaeales archaeon]